MWSGFCHGDEAGDVKNVDPALSASITFQVKGFVLVFCLSSERAFSSFCQSGVTQVFFGNAPKGCFQINPIQNA